jgi:hypothetical protein
MDAPRGLDIVFMESTNDKGQNSETTLLHIAELPVARESKMSRSSDPSEP